MVAMSVSEVLEAWSDVDSEEESEFSSEESGSDPMRNDSD